MRIGILRETKSPPDFRVPLVPKDMSSLNERYPDVKFVIQSSENRAIKDEQYYKAGMVVKEDLSDCNILMGIKEPDINTLIPEKTYLIFAHVAKKQLHNKKLLQEIIKKKITLIDYEYLVDKKGNRVIAFGKWAGIVGAYNTLLAWGLRTGKYELKPAYLCQNYEEVLSELKKVDTGNQKIIITGAGRVASGIVEILKAANFKMIGHQEFLFQDYDCPVFCQLDSIYYVKHKDGLIRGAKHFYKYPEEYVSTFAKYSRVADIFITGHFWDPLSPHFFTIEEMRKTNFTIKLIGDISCDVNGPIPSTIRATEIRSPFYDYNPSNEKEEPAFSSESNISVMAVDNLPCELPVDASVNFSHQLVTNVFDNLVGDDKDKLIKKATIVKNGMITERFSYLEEFINE